MSEPILPTDDVPGLLYAALVLLATILGVDIRNLRVSRSAEPEEVGMGVEVKLTQIEGRLQGLQRDMDELLRMHRDPESPFATVKLNERVEHLERELEEVKRSFKELSDEIRRSQFG